MAQYESRMRIEVSSPEEWKKLQSIQMKPDWFLGNSAEIFDTRDSVWEICDWSCTEKDLKDLVTKISNVLGTSGIIFADTTNINTDPYAYIVYSAGFGVKDKYFRMDEFCFETDISNLPEYLNYKNHFSFDKTELKLLEAFGVERVKEGRNFIFRNTIINEGLENEIFLTETRFNGRIERIEKIKVGDELKLVYNTHEGALVNEIEVFHELGSLGILDDTAADIMAPILAEGKKEFDATVYNLIPLSKRSKRYTTPFLSIHIQFKKETPKKHRIIENA